jgi:hypothetical protein
MVINMKNKRGWIEILEAFFAIMLVAVFLIIVLNNSNKEGDDFAYEVYQIQISILREIQINDTMREDIASAEEPLPIEWDDSRFPESVKNKILERTPNYLECVGKICNTIGECNPPEIKGKDVYANFVTITTTLGEEVFRKINLFCWNK